MIAGMVLSNLFYVVGAIVAATVVSAFVLLHHRRPKSLEAGIEMFSRELRALEPERRDPGAGSQGSRVVPTEGTRDGGPRPAMRNGATGGAGRARRAASPRDRAGAGSPAGASLGTPQRQSQDQALHRGPTVKRLGSPSSSSAVSPSVSSGESAGESFSTEPTTQPTNVVALPVEDGRRNEARAPWPHQEDEPG
jgi:hypothetical protein